MAKSIEVHQSLIRTKIDGLMSALTPKPPAPTIDVTVKSGLHADFTCSLSRHSFTIGSDATCDLVLLDDDIKEKHATILISSSLFGSAVQIDTTQMDVALDGKPIQANTPSAFDTLPAQLKLGSVAIDFAAQNKTQPSRLSKGVDLAIRTSAITLMFFLVLLGLDLASQTTANASVPPQNGKSESSDQAVSARTVPETLQDKIVAAGLDQDLKVAEQSDTLLVSGSLSDLQMIKWQTIHQWFDSQPEVGLLSANVRNAPVLDTFPAISSIRLGDTPQVRLLNGQIARVGDIVHDGWRVKAITAKGLELENGTEQAQIAF